MVNSSCNVAQDRPSESGRQVSQFTAVLQLTAMSLGPGLFTLPCVFAELGIVQSTIAVVCISFFVNFAMQRLLDVAAEYRLTSYEALAEKALGNSGNTIMAVVTFITTFIASCAFLSTAASLLVDVFTAFVLDINVNNGNVAVLSSAKQVVVLAVLTAGVLPLWMSPTMGDKAWISSVGVCVMLTSVAFFVGYCIHQISEHGSQSLAPPTGSIQSLLENIATLAFSFSMVFAIFPVLGEWVESSPGDDAVTPAVTKLKSVVSQSVALCALSYLAVGILGALSFGKDTKTIALANLSLSEPLTQIAHFFVGVSLSLNVAIISFPTVKSLELLCRTCCACGELSLHSWLAALVALAIVIVDSTFPTKIIFALCGSLGLGMAAYIMPCIVSLRLDKASPLCSLRKGFTPVVLLFGLVLVLGSTPMTIVDLLQSGSSSSTSLKQLIQMQWCSTETLAFV
eukprot:TRINITY_DN23246_c0_g1_i2.p1 TRINITY_DN23246_c0_g1~~TRINITY_DN23246_c0_g1_i2.p1  ORF type:complete len:455 (+),score=53.40 TRINITY_DN23246_c0_g1_i2:142-1506(+)